MLTKLLSPENLVKLRCNNNLIKKINLPDTLTELDCENNLLTELNYIPDSIDIYEYIDNNPFKYPFRATIENIRAYNKFRYTYFKLKYSTRIEKMYLHYKMYKIRDELLAVALHPERIRKWISMGATFSDF
jgi:hypothetical protein